MRTAREIIRDVATVGMAAARGAGFRKSGFNYYRRVGETTQVINIQLSQVNAGDAGHFYVNVGISVDAIWHLLSAPPRERLPEYECHLRSRLEQLVPGAPRQWDVNDSTDCTRLGGQLARCFQQLLAVIDPLDTPEALMRSRMARRERMVLAQLQYLAGAHADTLATLRAIAAEFQDRQGMSVVELRERLGLVELPIG